MNASPALRSGDSFWRSTGTDPVPCPQLDGATSCEVAIIGSGITGALVGDMLSRAGLDTVLLDKGSVGLGSTAASTGLLQYEVDTPLVELIPRVGEARAVHAYRRGLAAIDELESLTSSLRAACGFARRSSLCLASRNADRAELLREFECQRHFGFNVSLWERRRLLEQFGIVAAGGLGSVGDGEVNPYALTQALTRRAMSNGMRAFSGVRVESLEECAAGVKVASSTATINAQSVVVATGYSARPFLPEHFATLQTTYVVTSEPLLSGGWSDRCLLWETARPYFYARQTPDGRVLMGGEDTPHADDHQDDSLLAKKAEQLQVRFAELFPGIRIQPAYVWAGTFAETKDGLPFIGRRSGSDRIYFALGYGGNGITFSMIAAGLVRDLILGRANPDAAVFGFNR